MLALLSPAKNMREMTQEGVVLGSPMFKSDAFALARELCGQTSEHIQKLMGVSPSLAELNLTRFKTAAEGKAAEFPAVLLFYGDVYRAMRADSFDVAAKEAASRRIRILSGLYGLLRPYDAIFPYRLEMGVKLSYAGHSDLYGYWGGRLSEALNREAETAGTDTLLNLASDEYSAAVFGPKARQSLKLKYVHVRFKERTRDGLLRVVGVNAKRARGAAAAFLAVSRPETIEDFKVFSAYGYRFAEEETDGGLLFVKDGGTDD